MKYFLIFVLVLFFLIIHPTKLIASLNPDINGDGVVDIVDIGIAIDNYAKVPIPNPKADVNGDGVVNIIDIGILIDNYGKVFTPPPLKSPTPVPSGDHKIVAVGDMVCGAADIGRGYPCQAGATAATIKQINPGLVLALGDNQYESGSLADFNAYYTPLYGDFRNITRPVPGNHEYGTSGASGYYTYFGQLASPQDINCKSNCRGYYSYDLGNWHVIALNSECASVPGGCGAGSPQESWLKIDLANQSAGKCILAYWHEARYTSGHDGDTNTATQTTAFWQDLYNAKADVILNGHSHNYERFDLQNPSGVKASDGIRQFVIGTGGRDFTGWWTSTMPNSQVRNNDTFGVLQLILHPTSYDWQFVPSTGINGYKNGIFTDSGTTNCH